MLAIPYSRYLFGIIPWYSFLIVLGAAAAIFLASKEEIRAGLPKDTVTDFSLIAIPCGIIGARIYMFFFHGICSGMISFLFSNSLSGEFFRYGICSGMISFLFSESGKAVLRFTAR